MVIKKGVSYSGILTIFMLCLGCLIVYGSFLSGHKFLIYNDTGSDTFDSYWPMISELRDRLLMGQLPFWSFRTAGGIDFYSTCIFIGDPFFLVYLPFGGEWLPYTFAFVTTIKVFLAGFFFYKYIKYLKVSNHILTMGAVLYAFNGYIILWGQHYHFINIVMYIPLLLWGYEKWLAERRPILLIIATFLIALNSFYFFYMVSLFFFLYAVVSYIVKNKFRLLEFLKFVSKTIMFYVLGVGGAAFLIIPVVTYMMKSPRLSGSLGVSMFQPSTPLFYITSFFRTFSNNSLGVAGDFSGAINYYEAPVLYTSLLFVLLIPQLIHNFNIKEKALTIICLLIVFVCLIFPFFSSAFNAFNKIDYRWTFIIVASEVILTILLMQRIVTRGFVKKTTLCVSATVILGLYWIMYNYSGHKLSWLVAQKATVFNAGIKISIFIMLYTLLLALFKFKKYIGLLSFALLICMYVEVMSDSFITVNKRDNVLPSYLSWNVGYFDSSSSIIRDINSEDPNNFFRVKKDFNSRFLDDALLQRYNGIKSYNSLNDPSYLQFLQAFNIPAVANNTLISGLGDKIQIEALMGVKYLLSRTSNPSYGYSLLGTNKGISFFENRFSLPLGFMFNSVISRSEFDKLTTEQKDNIALKVAVLEDKDYKLIKNVSVFDLRNLILPQKEINNLLSVVFQNSIVVKNEFPSIIQFTALNNDPIMITSLDKPITGRVVVSFTSNSSQVSEGQIYWKKSDENFNDNAKKSFEVKAGENNYEVDLGYLENIDSLRLDIAQQVGDYTVKNFKVERASLGTFEDDVNERKANSLHVEKYHDSLIEGEIKSETDGILFFSIPYNAGWAVEVDNRKEKLLEIDAGLSGVYVNKGLHQIKLRFIPPNLKIGILISVFSLFIFISIIINQFRKSRNITDKIN